jgi:hypothetical protein
LNCAWSESRAWTPSTSSPTGRPRDAAEIREPSSRRRGSSAARTGPAARRAASPIGDELGDDARGFVFYHQQATETAVEGHGLYLAFGARSKEKTEQRAIADQIAHTLREQGLVVVWSGALDRSIKVDVTWGKRRSRPRGSPGEAPRAFPPGKSRGLSTARRH